jgi:hypothetical protein
MAPVGVEVKRVAVEMRGNVAGNPGIGVLSPRPTETIGLLVDGDVRQARLGQFDGAQDSCHPGPDDGDSHSHPSPGGAGPLITVICPHMVIPGVGVNDGYFPLPHK